VVVAAGSGGSTWPGWRTLAEGNRVIDGLLQILSFAEITRTGSSQKSETSWHFRPINHSEVSRSASYSVWRERGVSYMRSRELNQLTTAIVLLRARIERWVVGIELLTILKISDELNRPRI
jgi:hypothetical protein